jgi:hypothetical protein
MYVTADDVYAATKLDSTVVPEASVESFIKAAEKVVDRYTFTTYWKVDQAAQTVDSSTSTVITVSGTPYIGDTLIGKYVWVYDGTASGQVREITDNDTNTITVSPAFDTTPGAADSFRVIYTATNPKVEDVQDGNDMKYYFLPEYPIRIIESLSIDDVAITPSSLYTYSKFGKIQLSDTSEKQKFIDWKPQTIDYSYWYGVYPIPEEVKRAVVVVAGMLTLGAQTGGTYNVPSTYSLPEGSVSIGQAYVNIRETFNMLKTEWNTLQSILIRYSTSV